MSQETTTAKNNKWLYVPVIQGNYAGYGFEDLCEYDIGQTKDARADLKEYRLSDPKALFRLIKRRIPNPETNQRA